MSQETGRNLDPRIRRTRQLLQQALENLLLERDFDKISVQDITDAATLNRATFYCHYPDKFRLLECLVESRFQALLQQRGVQLDTSCGSALHAMVLAVCDFLDSKRALEPAMEHAIIAVIRRMVSEGLQRHAPEQAAYRSLDLMAAAASWAIYGAVKEWFQTPARCVSEEIAGVIAQLVSPLLSVPAECVFQWK
jgi:AcrR family transcriptional regulator